jgi:hypothetical protein
MIGKSVRVALANQKSDDSEKITLFVDSRVSSIQISKMLDG